MRHYKPCDAKSIASWIKDEDTLKKWGLDRFGDYPVTEEKINDKYLNCNGDCDEPDNFYPMTVFDETGVLGHLIMRYAGPDKETIRFGFVIIDDCKRGQGYGKRMLQLALKYAFEIYQAKRVALGVLEDNWQAYHCYQAVGFMENGKESCVEAMGEQWKIIEMEILKQNYD